jgi:predicted dehydrogenase
MVGCGQVYRRLYAPTLGHSASFETSAAVDPAGVPDGLRSFASVGEMCSSGAVDCVVVLSPPGLHAEHVATALSHGLPVLVEKPPALSLAQINGWNTAGDALVTPAFSRRYWNVYRTPRPLVRQWALTIHTNPADWAATHRATPEVDLLPHVIDLARWLGDGEIEDVHVRRTGSQLGGEFGLKGGACFVWDIGHGASYREQLTSDGVQPAGRARPWHSAKSIIRRTPGRDVEGVAMMLEDWAVRLAGGSPSMLPSLLDALRCVEVMDTVGQRLAETP